MVYTKPEHASEHGKVIGLSVSMCMYKYICGQKKLVISLA